MPHVCLDCGNKSSRHFPNGRCPACESYNVKSSGNSNETSTRRKPKSKAQMMLVIGLWLLVAYGVWDNYLRDI